MKKRFPITIDLELLKRSGEFSSTCHCPLATIISETVGERSCVGTSRGFFLHDYRQIVLHIEPEFLKSDYDDIVNGSLKEWKGVVTLDDETL